MKNSALYLKLAIVAVLFGACLQASGEPFIHLTGRLIFVLSLTAAVCVWAIAVIAEKLGVEPFPPPQARMKLKDCQFD